MADPPCIKPTFNHNSEAELQKRFKTPEGRGAAIKTIERAAKLMERATAELAKGLKSPSPSLDNEPKIARANAHKQAMAAAQVRFDSRRVAIIKARDSQLQKIERKQFMPNRRHVEPEQEKRFQDWARGKRDELHKRQHAEKTQLIESQKKASSKHLQQWKAGAGAKRDELRVEYGKLLTEPPGRLAAKMYAVSGLKQMNEARAEKIGNKISAMEEKVKDEQLAIIDKHDHQTAMLERSHARESVALEEGITKARELSEDFSFAASDRYYTLSQVFNLAAGSDGPDLGGGRGRSISEPGPGKPSP